MRKSVVMTMMEIFFLGTLSAFLATQQPASDPGSGEAGKIKELLLILRDKQMQQSQPDRVIGAIKQLGELKSADSIDDLIALITFRQKFDWEDINQGGIVYSQPPHLISALEHYPAAGALFRIGKPSIPALIKLIESNPADSLESLNAHTTIMIIFRDNPREGVRVLRKALAKATSQDLLKDSLKH